MTDSVYTDEQRASDNRGTKWRNVLQEKPCRRTIGKRHGIVTKGNHEMTSAVTDTACGVGYWVRDTAVADTCVHDTKKHLQTEVVQAKTKLRVGNCGIMRMSVLLARLQFSCKLIEQK